MQVLKEMVYLNKNNIMNKLICFFIGHKPDRVINKKLYVCKCKRCKQTLIITDIHHIFNKKPLQ